MRSLSNNVPRIGRIAFCTAPSELFKMSRFSHIWYDVRISVFTHILRTTDFGTASQAAAISWTPAYIGTALVNLNTGRSDSSRKYQHDWEHDSPAAFEGGFKHSSNGGVHRIQVTGSVRRHITIENVREVFRTDRMCRAVVHDVKKTAMLLTWWTV